MKKTPIIIIAFLFSIGAEAKDNPDYFVKKLSKGKEIMELKDRFYTSLFLAHTGDVMIEADYSADSPGPRYNLGTSTISEQQASLDIYAEGKTKSYEMTAGSNGIWNYSTMIQESKNPEYLSEFFGKELSLRLNLGTNETIQTKIYVPKPIVLTAEYNGKGGQGAKLHIGSTFKWEADPSNRNGVLISILKESANVPYLLLTPDDGALKVSELQNFIPRTGPFTVKFHRLEYKIVDTGNGKKYKFMSQTSVSSYYISVE